MFLFPALFLIPSFSREVNSDEKEIMRNDGTYYMQTNKTVYIKNKVLYCN